ncbi:MAG: hypothetical protein B9S32_00105 [Verrucomicrobia bacterium Tous-C9LFEB]|nr:MAG: hypothetical protein B9S32_00105 [Verrucomicrobia bacterium Tous-C9LFEB]
MTWEWIPILVVLGAALIWFEIFVPGMVLAASGTLCLVASVILTFKLYGPLLGIALLAFEILAFIVIASRWVAWFPKTKMGREVVLHTASGTAAQVDNKEALLQQSGVTISICRPSGIAEFAKQRYDVISEGSFLAAGQTVKVVAVEGNKIIVRAA